MQCQEITAPAKPEAKVIRSEWQQRRALAAGVRRKAAGKSSVEAGGS